MPPFEQVPMPTKRLALVNLLTSVTTNFDDFVFTQRPTTPMMNMGSRYDRREIQENANGVVRHIEVYYDGPKTNLDESDMRKLFRKMGEQMGAIDMFKVCIWWEVSYDDNDFIDSYSGWESFLTSYDPKGIFPTVRETTYLQPIVDGIERTVLLSTLDSVVFPNVPRPLQKTSSKELAHYCEFAVAIADF